MEALHNNKRCVSLSQHKETRNSNIEIVLFNSQVPAHSGWILDGFPPDISLAHLLEKALGGCEEETKEAAIDQTDIIADCSPPTPPPPPAPVLDVVLMLNIPDECAVRRAYRQAGMFGFFFESRFSGTFLVF